MIEHPILFSGPMVRAILDGRKTQTRRVIKPQPGDDERDDGYLMSILDRCPYGEPGDLLWVRETWCPVHDAQYGAEDWVDYRATPREEWSHPAGWHHAPEDPAALKWKPSIYMPRWASRLTLRITNVRVERVQDISAVDARDEGTPKCKYAGDTYCTQCGGHEHLCDRDRFRVLWDEINAKRGHSWDSNPWVWVIEFIGQLADEAPNAT